jgi:hypothetical protein
MRALSLLIGFICLISFPLPSTKITLLPVLGFALILFSVLRMEKMEPVFKKAKILLFLALPISAALLGLQIYATVTKPAAWYDTVYIATRLLTEIFEIAVMFFIYIGIKTIGTKAEIPALEKHSSRNMTLMVVYIIVYAAINLLNKFAPSLFTGFEFVMIWPFIIGYLWRAFNVWMAFSLLTKVSVSHD